ncbi:MULTISPECIES: inorganic triphosphatase [unclassified Tatumella]|uniref:CYTH domain-containing protein n=1 Tax=unclassified Tatumella TaxID=2649542 RepID=UPI001BAF0B8A|nr:MULTISPECIES: inorganic triphosphatase [unclassified Tatumella]MBS0855743.1 inorganic triphosphatase [Tatumella sp. JGM16]MBS0912651.1 inorganic triphosphatase [Tatumella sp. JGM91]
MTIETELKFIASPLAASQLADRLNGWPHQHSAPQALANIYFETPDNQLRRWDMGLRIRGINQHYEMTLKTSGQTIGGLHQRPEFNVSLADDTLDIRLLPESVWPEGIDVTELQQRLQPLFRTDFVREKWLVSCGDSEIEVAFDQGAVIAGELQTPLFEVELELKKGTRQALMAFAFELIAGGGLRPGSLSKAARGYHLAQGNLPKNVRPFPRVQAEKKLTCEQGLQTMLSVLLNEWQYHEELWLEGNKEAGVRVREILLGIREVFTLFGSMIPRKATGRLRELLLTLAQSAVDSPAEELCFSAASAETQLALTHWLTEQPWKAVLEEKHRKKLQGSFKRFCDVMLGRVVAELKGTTAEVSQPAGYQDKAQRIHRQILAVCLLCGAYPLTAVDEWLAPWWQVLQQIHQERYHDLPWTLRSLHRQAAFWLNGNEPGKVSE